VAAVPYSFDPVSFTNVRITSGFWAARQDVNRRTTLPFALSQCEESGRLRNFDLAAEVMKRRASGDGTFQVDPPTIYPFDDTDAYKAIEAASYELAARPSAPLSRTVDAWIARIAAAQEPDGYLFTFRTMHPDSPGHEWVGRERWEKDPELSHELYNSGHLYEAGVAHFEATGSRALLDVCLRNAELLWRDFGDGRRRLAPGHPVVEMALVKLHRATGDARFLELARIFLDARGPGGNPMYQLHANVVEQAEAVGHAVRANYLYSGMADVAALAGDARYFDAATKIWRNVVAKKLAVTGGVGARADGEAYGDDYELPASSYNETCAALALMMWAHRMFLATGRGEYMDVFERAAYNGFISGVSLSGDRFFYTNPLAYDGAAKCNHGHAGRVAWFGCSCCPPNLMRTLASFGGYFYAVQGDSLTVNVYAESEADARVGETSVRLRQATEYPWSGRVALSVTPGAPKTFALRLRIPGWVRGEPVPSDLYRYERADGASFRVLVNGEPVAASAAEGYVTLRREWRESDAVELDLAMPVRRVRGHERIAATAGRVALERGPVVYCVEQLDSERPLDELAVPANTRLEPVLRPDVLGGATLLRVAPPDGPAFQAVPYFAWNNRGLGPMAVWLPDGSQ
jgi:DUF1680 family protein